MRAFAILAVLAVAGCADGPVAQDGPPACAAFADCLFQNEGPLPVVVHLSPDVPSPSAGLQVLADQVALLAERPVALSNGSAFGPLPDVVDDGMLSALHGGAPPSELHVYVVDAVRLEGDQPTSGLSFPGSQVLFLFPGTLDLRVDEAGLAGPEREAARATLEGVVLAHEFGHALGLVGCGIPMQAPHMDEASACHSANKTSLMQPLVARVAQWPAWDEGAALGPFGWDADDLADVAAFRAAVRSPPAA